MAKTEFKGRHAELKVLDDLWNSPNATLLILYGRRRVGKTRLLTHWMGRHAQQAIYWVAEPTSALDQLRSFSQALFNFNQPDVPAPLEFSYATWEQALQQAAALAKERRLALFIDEVTYLLDVHPAFPGTLQKMWDHYLSKTNLILALSGSQMGMMQNLLAYEAPLYGRAAAQIKLPPLPFDVTPEFFPGYGPAERVKVYAAFGGIPAYWERLDLSMPVMDNLRDQLLTSNTLMQEEPRLLLQDFINDPHNYVAIMRAIAHGALTQHLIAKRTGLSSGHVSKYLSVLRGTGFVERQVPVTENAATSRRGRYFVTDPYLRFYYRFLSAYQAQLALGEQQQAMKVIEQFLPEFIETNTWQELCREWLLRASAHEELPVQVEDVGGAWKRTNYFDVVGISRAHNHLVLGSSLWNQRAADLSAMQTLMEKTSSIVPKGGKWSVYYVGFASGGWTKEARALAEELIRNGTGRNWKPAGLRLMDLQQVDADLTRWSEEHE